MAGKTLELFDKIYGCYYQVVRQILEEAAASPVTTSRMEALCRELAFEESAFAILPKLISGSWSPLLKKEGKNSYSSALSSPDFSYPLTALQKAWLKSLLSDQRISLFFAKEEMDLLSTFLKDTPSLFHPDDFHYYDQYQDGDSYKSTVYISAFHTVLASIRSKKILLVSYRGKKQEPVVMEVAPCRLQYSSKDDKFRLLCLKRTRRGFTLPYTLNISRILDCHISSESLPADFYQETISFCSHCSEPVSIEIDGRRNSLERSMLHFANYEKHTEYDEERGIYICSIYYDSKDETELLIELLSFGPVIRILGPKSILKQVGQRIARQHELLYGTLI
ncbi:WYL domain-containing protein [Lachnospiraceae bacterium 62-35]